MNLTTTEKTVLLEMLNQLRDHQAAAGCNDHELDDTPDNRDLSDAVDRHCGRDPEVNAHKGVIYLNDYEITSYLIDRISDRVSANISPERLLIVPPADDGVERLGLREAADLAREKYFDANGVDIDPDDIFDAAYLRGAKAERERLEAEVTRLREALEQARKALNAYPSEICLAGDIIDAALKGDQE